MVVKYIIFPSHFLTWHVPPFMHGVDWSQSGTQACGKVRQPVVWEQSLPQEPAVQINLYLNWIVSVLGAVAKKVMFELKVELVPEILPRGCTKLCTIISFRFPSMWVISVMTRRLFCMNKTNKFQSIGCIQYIEWFFVWAIWLENLNLTQAADTRVKVVNTNAKLAKKLIKKLWV